MACRHPPKHQVRLLHPLKPLLAVAHKIAMIYEGRIEAYGTPDEIMALDNPVVQQFLNGESDGPMLLGD